MKKVFVIANPAAGRGKTAVVLPDVEEFLSAREIEYQLHLTTMHKTVKEIMQTGFDRSYSDVLAVGGDGTFNEVLNALDRFDMDVGVIQSGTGNDFSKALGPAVTMREQIRRAVLATPQLIDVGQCNGKLFHNGVGIGFDGTVAHRAAELKAEQKGSVLSYYQAIAETIAHYKPIPMRIKGIKDGRDVNTFMVTVANGVAFGGGLRVTPEANLMDGLLDVCHVDELSIGGRLWRLPILLLGKHTRLEKISYFKTEGIEILCQDEVSAHIDGETFKAKSFKIGLAEQKLSLRF